MIIDERQSQILQLLETKKFVSYKELSDSLYASISTIRRDVINMHAKGLLVIVKGGVASIDTKTIESSRSVRELEHSNAKRKIASLAKNFLFEGQSVFLDSSTTVGQLAYYFKEFQNITIVTNSLDVAASISQSTNLNVYLAGGLITRKTNSTSGLFSSSVIQSFNCDVFFFSCKGLNEYGKITEANPDTQKNKYEMIGNAKKKVLLLDNSKLDKTFLFTTCKLKDIDAIVLNEKPDDKYLALFKKFNVETIY